MPLFLFKIRASVLVLSFMAFALPSFFARCLFSRKSLPAWVDGKIQSFAKYCLWALRVRLDIENQSALARVDWSRPVIVVGNHQSYFDIPVVFSTLARSIGFLAKKQLFRIPFLGFWMKLIRCIAVDRDNPRAGIEIREKMEHAKTVPQVCIFPEGTRSRDGTVKPFKSGAFRLAVDLDAVILPIYIHGTRESWESRRNSSPVKVHSTVLEPIDVRALSAGHPVNPKTELAPLVYERVLACQGMAPKKAVDKL